MTLLLYFIFYTATSALDNESEKIVQEALDRAAQGISIYIQLYSLTILLSFMNRSNNIGDCTSFVHDSQC
jgi:ABC-type multidrug transport system fused ATPase/permease subunit